MPPDGEAGRSGFALIVGGFSDMSPCSSEPRPQIARAEQAGAGSELGWQMSGRCREQGRGAQWGARATLVRTGPRGRCAPGSVVGNSVEGGLLWPLVLSPVLQ